MASICSFDFGLICDAHSASTGGSEESLVAGEAEEADVGGGLSIGSTPAVSAMALANRWPTY